MAASGRIRRRLALAIVLTALIPVLVAIWMAERAIQKASSRFYTPELGDRLDQSLGLYQELAHAVKASMRHAASAIAENAELRDAANRGDREGTAAELKRQMSKYPSVVSLTVVDADGKPLARTDRGYAIDPKKENKLEVTRPLDEPTSRRGVGPEAEPPKPQAKPKPPRAGASAEPEVEDPEAVDPEAPDEEPLEHAGPRLIAVFAADRARFDELTEMSNFVTTYRRFENQRHEHEAAYLYAFALLLGITIVAAVGVGTFLARGVSSRIGELADATKRVGAGDLSIRVPEDGSDEIADLARAFNRMLGEVESSRARIEYLQRIGAWQEMARRLAHEIKNPLTPIQLAVQEIHRRYAGSEEAYRKLLDTTLEIVEDEVGTLRRLVSEFSGFARLPQARLEPADLAEFLRDQRDRISLVGDDGADGESVGEGTVLPRGVELEFALGDAEAPVHLDQQMLRRALINLIRNAGQAVEGAGKTSGRIQVRLHRDGDYYVIDIDDDGPGVPPEMRNTVFDPYVTTKTDGTGLGLAIVKKIVVEHGGSIVADESPLGGARMRMRIPAAGSAAAAAVLEARDWQAPPSSARASRRPSIANA